MKTYIVDKDNVESAMGHSRRVEDKNYGQNCFFNIINDSDAKEFLKFCEQYSEFTYVDAISGNKQPDGCRRFRTPLTFDQVIDKVTDDNHLGAGLKTYYRPLSKFFEYHEWEGGYIEGFIRGFDYDSDYGDIVIWQYIRMEHLETILKAFPNKLKYHD